MDGSVLSFLKAEWKVSDTGSAHWASSFGEGVCNDEGYICYFLNEVIKFYWLMLLLYPGELYRLLGASSFAMFGEIDLMFGIWVYNDELQIKFTFRSGPMIIGRVMPLDFEIWPLSPLYFTMIWDIDLIFGMRVYNHKLQINFEINLLFLAYYWGN
jgi:hypothetical protein